MILKEIQNFDLNQIANSGQCFRWKRTRENAYLVIHKDKVVTISQLGGGAFRLDCRGQKGSRRDTGGPDGRGKHPGK